jgi:hypothetical protein
MNGNFYYNSSRGGFAASPRPGEAGAGTGTAGARHVSDFLSALLIRIPEPSVVAKSPLTVRIDLPGGPVGPGGPISPIGQVIIEHLSSILYSSARGVEYKHHKEKTITINMEAMTSR